MVKYLPYPESKLRADASAVSKHFGYLCETGQLAEFLSLLDHNVLAAIIQAGVGGSGTVQQPDAKDATAGNSIKEVLAELDVINEVDKKLLEAARSGDLDLVSKLIEAGAEVSKAHEFSGRTALIEASENGHLEIMQLLITTGADVDASSTGGRTALISAVAEGKADEARLLLSAGSDAHLIAQDGWSAWSMASVSGHSDIVRLLLEYDSVADPKPNAGDPAVLIGACVEAEHADVVQCLIESGIDVNAKDEYGCFPLAQAAANGNVKTVGLLLKAGADVNALCGIGRSGFQDAMRDFQPEVVELLKAAGEQQGNPCQDWFE